MIDAGDPFAPQVGPPAFDRHQRQHAKDDETDGAGRDHDDRLVEGDWRPGEPAHDITARLAARRPPYDSWKSYRTDPRSPARRSARPRPWRACPVPRMCSHRGRPA